MAQVEAHAIRRLADVPQLAMASSSPVMFSSSPELPQPIPAVNEPDYEEFDLDVSDSDSGADTTLGTAEVRQFPFIFDGVFER